MKLKLDEATKPCGSLQDMSTGRSRVRISEIIMPRAVSKGLPVPVLPRLGSSHALKGPTYIHTQISMYSQKCYMGHRSSRRTVIDSKKKKKKFTCHDDALFKLTMTKCHCHPLRLYTLASKDPPRYQSLAPRGYWYLVNQPQAVVQRPPAFFFRSGIPTGARARRGPKTSLKGISRQLVGAGIPGRR